MYRFSAESALLCMLSEDHALSLYVFSFNELACFHCVFIASVLFLIISSSFLYVSAQVGQLREVSNKAHNAELKLFLEVELGPVMMCWSCYHFFFCFLLIVVCYGF